jgi:hypothetical protein
MMTPGILQVAPEDPLMRQAWGDCLLWAIHEPAILQQFQQDTGLMCRPAKTAIEQMIDEASGRDESVAIAFVKWFNENVWGDTTDQGV